MSKRKFKQPNIQNRWLSKPNITTYLPKHIDITEEKEDFVVSFSHFSSWNGWQTFEEAESMKKLSQIMHAFSLLKSPVYKLESELWRKKFCNYWYFPKNSNFTCPKYITEDANWSRLHINWKYCVVWHIVWNVFYVVFFDSEHEFYPTELKHT